MAARSCAKEEPTECDALPYIVEQTGELESSEPKTEIIETMIPSLKRIASSSSGEDVGDDISSMDNSSGSTSSEDEDYQTAREDNRRRGMSDRTTNYSATRNKQSSVKKDKKSVVQNNITIGTLVGNLHIGPSFSAMSSMSNRSPREGSAEREGKRKKVWLLKNETNFSLSSKTNYKYFIINIIKLN
jgi:hypothetical protein